MSQETESIEEMIALLQGYLQQFAPPALAPLNWTPPKTVKVRGLEVSKKELQDLVKSYKTQLSILVKGEKGGGAPTLGFTNMGGMTNTGVVNPPASTTSTTVAPTTVPPTTVSPTTSVPTSTVPVAMRDVPHGR